MSINSVSFNEFDYNSKSNAVANKTTQSGVNSLNSSNAENELQALELDENSLIGEEFAQLSKEHQEIIKQLQETLNQIREEKRSLISQMANAESSEERQEINNQISELNEQSNSVFMDIIKQLQSYNSTLNELVANSVRQKVEDTSIVQSITAPQSQSSAALQTTLEGYNSQAGQKIAQSALTVDGTTGWCLKGVNDSLQRIYGKRLSYNSAYQAIPELQSGSGMGAHFKEVSVSRDELTSLPPGAIVVWEPNNGNPHGHISIALGDGRESSDHITKQMTGRNANFHVFIPIS